MLNYLLKIVSTLQIAFHNHGGIRYLLKKNSSIASFQICNSLRDLNLSINSIIDVGANIGQFSGAISRFYPQAKIFSFEPVPECYEQLLTNVKGQNNITSYNIALSDFNGELPFNKNQHTHASSALDITEYQKANLPKTSFFSSITVPCSKLDDIQLPLESPVLLKLDVQGLEKKVLEGAKRYMDMVEYIIIETSFVPMYKNEPLFEEMHNYLTSRNFEIIAPVGYLQIGNNSVIQQLDVLYKRKA